MKVLYSKALYFISILLRSVARLMPTTFVLGHALIHRAWATVVAMASMAITAWAAAMALIATMVPTANPKTTLTQRPTSGKP